MVGQTRVIVVLESKRVLTGWVLGMECTRQPISQGFLAGSRVANSKAVVMG